MKLKDSLIFLQRLVIIELEAIILILSFQIILKLFSMPDLTIPYVIWQQLLFVLTAFPLFYLTKRKNIRIWTAISLIIWLASGYWLGVTAYWLPVVLGIWRSIVIANEHEYLKATYKRVVIVMIIFTIYFMISNLMNTPLWWALPLLATACFGLTILGIACQNLLDQYSWHPNREEWMRICKNQLFFVVAMLVVIILLVLLRQKFIFLASKVVMVIWKLFILLITPLIIFLSKVSTFFYSLISGGRKADVKVQFKLSKVLSNVQANESSSALDWFGPVLSIIAVIGLLILLIRKIKNSFEKDYTKKEEADDWIEMMDQQKDQDKKNSLFSALKNLSIFSRKQKIDKVRLLYRDFLEQYKHMLRDKDQSTNPTTRDIIKKASEELPMNMEDLQKLTKVYEDHRYGGKASDPAVIDNMKKAVTNWMRSK